jgi:hypothetical protein
MATASFYPAGLTIPTGSNPVTRAARLQFATSGNASVWLLIPGVNLSCFLADGETVDPTNAAIAAVIAQALVTLTDNAGNPVSAYMAGHLVQLPTPPFNLG